MVAGLGGALMASGIAATTTLASAQASYSGEATKANGLHSKHKLIKRERVADEGESKITVIRDADTGILLFKAATAPDTEVVIDDPSVVEGDGGRSMFRVTASDDPDDPGVGISLAQSVAGPADAARQAAELTDADMDYRQGAIGLAPSERRTASGGIVASDCAKVTAGGEAYWRGCFERRHVPDDDPDHWYMLDSSWAHGHHEGWVGGLDWAYVANRYFKSEKNVLITRQRPVTDIEKSPCTNVTLSMAPEGIGASETFKACPERIKLGGDDDSVYATWDGWANRDDSWRAAAVITFARMQAGTNSVLTMSLKVDEDESKHT